MSDNTNKEIPFIWDLLNPNILQNFLYSNDDVLNSIFNEISNNDNFPLWDNIYFIKKIVNINGEYLACASERLRKDYAICLEALKNNFKAKEYIDISIKNTVVNDYLNYMKDNIKTLKSRNLKNRNLKTGIGTIENCREEIYLDEGRPIKRTRTYEKDLCNLISSSEIFKIVLL